MNVGFISLGCSKNLIDTEVAIGLFKDNNYKIVNNPEEADILVINTCGFIESAKEEAINTILEMAEYKKKRCKYLIAMGCLVQRYYDDLIKALPEVDLFIKIDEYNQLWNKIEDLIKREIVEKSKVKTSTKISEIKPLPMPTYNEFMERVVTTGENYAYLKIGEGCSNKCTYCAIPYIRGPFVSRKMEEILDEAEMLARKGIKELIVIAQDTTKYGVDIYGESKLAELLEKLSKIKGIEWIRFLYSYPEGITDKLIEIVANNDKIAKYFDIPIQHISDPILKKMNRKTSKENIIKILEKIRNKIPNVTLRTSLIVGFPGETKENFEELLEFVKDTKFDKLGTFMYSKEEGTPAAKLPNQIHGNTKKARYNKIMEAQQEISKQILEEKIGKTYKILVEDISFDKKYLIGRTMQDVPEEDGLVYIKKDKNLNENKVLNNFVNCKIIDVSNYDLIGEIQ
jgi:ribosomal protein S12 methylthiotransferase